VRKLTLLLLDVSCVASYPGQATVGSICGKGRFYAWNEGVMDDESGDSMELMEEGPLKELGEAELESLVRG